MKKKTLHNIQLSALLAKRLLPLPLVVLLLLLPTGCKKDLDLDYHQTTPLYVVEGSVTPERTRVRITQTQDMTDNSGGIGVEGANIYITSGDSIRERVLYSRNGYYLSALRGQPGVRYQIDIDLDGHHFTSSSTMQPMPTLNSARFVWKKFATERLLMIDLHVQDIPGATNYYFLHLFRNDVGYRWALMRDTQRDANGQLQQLFTCCSERDMKKGTSNDVINEGDVMRLEVRAIDRTAYDYLYSMQVMENTGTNPIANFSGGCLGYFTAYSQVEYEMTFHRAEVEEEE